MPQPWTTSASATHRGADGIVTLVEGSSFCISSRSGEIDPAHPQGLFFRDTRFLSELRLHAQRTSRPSRSRRRRTDPFSAVFVLRGHPSHGRADSHLVVFRRRYVGRGMREDLEIENFGEEAAFCSVELADRRRLRRPVRGQGGPGPQAGQARRARPRDRALTFTYKRQLVQPRHARRLHRRAAHLTATHVQYEIVVPPRGRWSTCMQVTPVIGDAGGHAALPVRAAGRALDAGRPARGVDAAPAAWSRPTTTSSGRCSTARRRTSPACASSIPNSPTARSSPRARRGS